MSGFLGLGRARRVLLLAGLVFAALPAGSALAKTIGQTGGRVGCPAQVCMAIPITWSLPAVGRSRASRSDLTRQIPVGSWISWCCGRRDRELQGGGKTGLVTLAGSGLETFPANISVRAGDILGFWPEGTRA